jgi:hypothetical protein
MATISLPLSNSHVSMARVPNFGKRNKPVTVKMSQEHYDYLRKAAKERWPGALESGMLTDSSMVLGLAVCGADCILTKKRPKRPKPS